MNSIYEVLALYFDLKPLKFFSLYGLIAIILIALPSLLFMKKANETRPDDLEIYSLATARFELITRTLLNFVLPLMGMPHLENNTLLYLSIVTLIIYYILWIRFVKDGSYYPDIYMKKFLGIPIPFDLTNTFFFIFVSLYLRNIVALTCALFYALSRILNAVKAMNDLNSREK